MADSDRALPPDDFPPDSRILLLARRLERHMPQYFPLGPPTPAQERRVILAAARDVLPPADPPTAEERLLARLVKFAVLAAGPPFR